jgi:hypothetical protein
MANYTVRRRLPVQPTTQRAVPGALSTRRAPNRFADPYGSPERSQAQSQVQSQFGGFRPPASRPAMGPAARIASQLGQPPVSPPTPAPPPQPQIGSAAYSIPSQTTPLPRNPTILGVPLVNSAFAQPHLNGNQSAMQGRRMAGYAMSQNPPASGGIVAPPPTPAYEANGGFQADTRVSRGLGMLDPNVRQTAGYAPATNPQSPSTMGQGRVSPDAMGLGIAQSGAVPASVQLVPPGTGTQMRTQTYNEMLQPAIDREMQGTNYDKRSERIQRILGNIDKPRQTLDGAAALQGRRTATGRKYPTPPPDQGPATPAFRPTEGVVGESMVEVSPQGGATVTARFERNRAAELGINSPDDREANTARLTANRRRMQNVLAARRSGTQYAPPDAVQRGASMEDSLAAIDSLQPDRERFAGAIRGRQRPQGQPGQTQPTGNQPPSQQQMYIDARTAAEQRLLPALESGAITRDEFNEQVNQSAQLQAPGFQPQGVDTPTTPRPLSLVRRNAIRDFTTDQEVYSYAASQTPPITDDREIQSMLDEVRRRQQARQSQRNQPGGPSSTVTNGSGRTRSGASSQPSNGTVFGVPVTHN